MTIQEAKELLAANWWKFNPHIKPDDCEIFIGELVGEIPADDSYLPDSFLINAAVVDKGEHLTEDDWFPWAVSKINGGCRSAIDFCGGTLAPVDA